MTGRKKIFIGSLCVIILWIAAEILVSYKCLTVEDYTIKSGKIREDMKCVLISDLHNNEFGDHNQRLAEKIRDQKPDVILLAGDIINEDNKNSDIAVELVKKLKKIAPVYYSFGNHEEEYLKRKTSDLSAELKKAGAVVLDQEFSDIKVGKNTLRIGGMYDYAFSADLDGGPEEKERARKLYRFLTQFQNSKSFSIMMAHRPDSFIWRDSASRFKIDLVVSGHNHGGQVILPGKGGLYGGDQGWFPKYVDGIHHFKSVKNMIITRGLGSSKEILPRFHNIPEIVVIHLKKK